MENIIHALSPREQRTIFECLSAAEREDIFPEWEFETLYGIGRNKVSSVREHWPEVDVGIPDVSCAIVGALNHLLGYPWNHGVKWENFISVPPDAVRATLNKLVNLGL